LDTTFPILNPPLSILDLLCISITDDIIIHVCCMFRAVIKAIILWRTNSFCTLTTHSRHHACLVSNIQSQTQEEIRFIGVNFYKRSTFVLDYHKQLQNPPTALVHSFSTISMSENKYIVGYARLGTSRSRHDVLNEL
jgi:hypothetical protein